MSNQEDQHNGVDQLPRDRLIDINTEIKAG